MIKVVVSENITSALDRLSRKLDNMHPVMDSIGMELSNRISGRFEKESDPDGKKWAAHKPSTVKSYPKDGNGMLLNRTGQMLGSLNHQADGNSVKIGFPGHRDKKGKMVYPAYFHEYGTKNMARRGLIFSDPVNGVLSRQDEDAVVSIVNDYLRRTVG